MKLYPHGIAFLGLVLIAGFFLLEVERANTSVLNHAYWIEQVERKGSDGAYREFKHRHAQTPMGARHVAAHAFGRALYEAGGTEALAVCDTEFEYGCYHGFLSAAIAEGGEDRVRELDRVCVDEFGILGGGCLHGIGHGVLEYTGYERLTEALELCERATTQPVPLLGCTSGVFMEYFSPLVESPDGQLISTARKIDRADPYTPCPDVPAAYRAVCYYQLGQQLWELDPTYARLCSDLTGEDRTYCFMGIGEDSIGLSFSITKGLAACEQYDGPDNTACRAGIAWGMFAAEQGNARVSAACDVKDRARCLELADFTRGRDSNFPKP